MKAFKLFSVIFLAVCVLVQAAYAGLQPSTVEAFKKVEMSGIGTVYKMATMDGNIYIAGQPSQQGLRQLRKLKIKTFISLRPDGEMTFNEAQAVKKLGMNYIQIPVELKNFNLTTIKKFNKAIYSPKKYPIFIHCGSGNRVAMMLAFNTITEDKTPVAAAIEEAKQYGLTDSKLIKFIKQTAKKYNLPS